MPGKQADSAFPGSRCYGKGRGRVIRRAEKVLQMAEPDVVLIADSAGLNRQVAAFVEAI